MPIPDKTAIAGRRLNKIADDLPKVFPKLPREQDKWWYDTRDSIYRLLEEMETRLARQFTNAEANLTETEATINSSIEALLDQIASIQVIIAGIEIPDITSIEASLVVLNSSLSVLIDRISLLESDTGSSDNGILQRLHVPSGLFLYDLSGSWAVSGNQRLVFELAGAASGDLITGVGWDKAFDFSKTGGVGASGAITGAPATLRIGKIEAGGSPL